MIIGAMILSVSSNLCGETNPSGTGGLVLWHDEDELMTLTYIFHSGFVLETEQSILVFDYWLDPSGVMEGVLKKDKPLYVFSSHFHEDHFTKKIFEWKKLNPDITYIPNLKGYILPFRHFATLSH